MIHYLLATYIVVAFIGLFTGLAMYLMDDPAAKKTGARIILLAPIWPIGVLLYIPATFKALWRAAFPKDE